MTRIIGLGHRARHGKDTFADLLQHELVSQGATCRVYSFAYSLKCLARTLGMKGKDSKGLQLLGDAVRRFDQDYFIKVLAPQIDDDGRDFAVITDTRYLNEARWIKTQGGVTVKVQRLENGLPFKAADRPDDHPSEAQLADYTWDHNLAAESGDLEGLGRAARWLADQLLMPEAA